MKNRPPVCMCELRADLVNTIQLQEARTLRVPVDAAAHDILGLLLALRISLFLGLMGLSHFQCFQSYHLASTGTDGVNPFVHPATQCCEQLHQWQFCFIVILVTEVEDFASGSQNLC